jgi:hypothetical protein
MSLVQSLAATVVVTVSMSTTPPGDEATFVSGQVLEISVNEYVIAQIEECDSAASAKNVIRKKPLTHFRIESLENKAAETNDETPGFCVSSGPVDEEGECRFQALA